jgi:hypothetical protein
LLYYYKSTNTDVKDAAAAAALARALDITPAYVC